MTRVGNYRIDRPTRAVGAVTRYTSHYQASGEPTRFAQVDEGGVRPFMEGELIVRRIICSFQPPEVVALVSAFLERFNIAVNPADGLFCSIC